MIHEDKIQEQIDLMVSDLEDNTSVLYNYVFLTSGLSKDEFKEMLESGIRNANGKSFYGGYDTVYAAYTYIEGRQVYFKFSAPKAEVENRLGGDAHFLELYPASIYLIEFGPDILMKYALPFYYREFGSYSKDLKDHPDVKNWKDFRVVVD